MYAQSARLREQARSHKINANFERQPSRAMQIAATVAPQ
ncbi:hypothetical protein KPSA3_05449 [Pseudomonas syringae pv. actinidiae]|uniref:Uncharacterized protein n=1 Tax=Pseudomonas syringae pv. actinidiae TaxID=103796 RepID=A0AAN4TN11_PSESF|nr:hypothetical protein KPSA3_05449 [Pseudomonas syringae pv. actinidiae]